MSLVKVSGNASGTGTFEIAAPNTNTNYTITLPQATTTLVGTDATQTLTNKTINGGALQSGTAVASTSGTSIDFTSIPSWVKRITVIYSGVSTNGTSNYLIQLGAGSPTTSGYESANSSGSAGVATSSSGAGHLSCTQASAASTFSGNIIFSNISGNSWVGSGVLTAFNTPSFQISASKVTLGGTLDRVRITMVNGTDTFDAGSINILYE